jgi:hypothetical protein
MSEVESGIPCSRRTNGAGPERPGPKGQERKR